MTTIPPRHILVFLDPTRSDHPAESWREETQRWAPSARIESINTGDTRSLLEVTEAGEIDLVVIEQHDEGLIRRLVGATSTDLVRHRSPCSVLLARVLPTPAGVLAAYDGTLSSQQALRAAASFCAGTSRTLDVLHVRTPGDEADPTPHELDELPVRPAHVASTHIVDSGEVGRIIDEAARARNAGLIVIGSHDHPRLWSIMAQSVGGYLSHHGNHNVLIVKS